MSKTFEKVINQPEPTPTLTMQQKIMLEVKKLASNATALKFKITTAKTSFKIKYYGKKLKKNNERAYDLLLALDRVADNELSQVVKDNIEAGEDNEVA